MDAEKPPVRFSVTLEARDDQALSELCAQLHRLTGKRHSRAEAIRYAVRQTATVVKEQALPGT